ncbi:MAG: formylglycine-generating enzyme family protein, partial [Planctomycetes bacterium]|nr:formylglycine-generating enzyme family protein [Planctomycetota bacterium]
LGKCEVTQQQYEKLMGDKPWSGERHVKEGPEYAATYVSWDDAQEFCRKLSSKEGRTYRLPTEAEWEYACRAGSKTRYSFGDDVSKYGAYAWYKNNTDDVGEEYAHRVGLKRANAWGLHDMHGNVFESCQDWHGDEYYKNSPAVDPTGPITGSGRVIRGSCWYDGPRGGRSAFRFMSGPEYRRYDLGFRVVLVPPE